ncbi:MAG: hypothetical protein LBQ31_04520 [Bacteroidales bacterium]|jgi:hypothetical protein|nr:hypothetical protein [Bacteroidales bacterium]
MRNILLIEPNYKNKYPPIGLMKIATYHRMLGDNVTFFKGDLRDLVIENITNACIDTLKNNDSTIFWNEKKQYIFQYIKKGHEDFLEKLPESNNRELVLKCLKDCRDFYRKKKYEEHPIYDRIYVATLFTFYWKVTIDTINFAKKLVKDIQELKVGGVMATVLYEDVVEATDIVPYKGLLDKSGILDDNKIIIDTLPLDYSILDEIGYKYPENNAYYGYMTRGCIRDCSFCAVPTIEPKYCDYIPIVDRIEETKKKYGDKRNLLLLDNNVLASKQFPAIIEEIKKAGFTKGAKYMEPNQFDIAIKNLSENTNDKAYIKRAYNLIRELLNVLKGEVQQSFYNYLKDNNVLDLDNITKEKLLELAPYVSELYNKHIKRRARLRYVDFNQGVDARLFTDEKAKLLSEIPIRPLRIAFDNIKGREKYEKAIRMSIEAGIKDFSNYLLYNFDDEPVDLYTRLKINVELCEEYKYKNISIYSFPMKYHPITGKDRFNRDFLGEHWNRKFIRAIQTILNATKGKIGKGKSFFYKAFGNTEEEFERLLYMPEPYILYRLFFEEKGYTAKWWKDFNSLTAIEKEEAKKIIENNHFTDIHSQTSSKNVLKVLKHYTITRNDITKNEAGECVFFLSSSRKKTVG